MCGRGRVVSCVYLSVCLFVCRFECPVFFDLFRHSRPLRSLIKMDLDNKRVFLHSVFENDCPEAQKSLFSCDLDAS